MAVTIDDGDKENNPAESQCTGTDSSMRMDRSETKLEVERTGRTKRLYGTKQKRFVVVYAKQHSVAAATKHFSIPRTTIGHWMVDGYFD